MENVSKISFKDFAGVDLNTFQPTGDDLKEVPLAVNFQIKISELAKILKLSPQSITYELKKLKIDYKTVNRSAFLSQSQTRRYLEHKGYKYNGTIIDFLMLKGGVGKTTTSFNLAVMLNKLGARVLYIDLDPQGNATNWFAVNTSSRGIPVFINIIRDEATIEECIVNISEGFDLIPSDFDNAPCDFEITIRKKNYVTLVTKLIASVRNNYDYVIIDSNPTLSMINESSAIASDMVIIPVTLDSFAKAGLKETLSDLWRISRESERFLDFKILINMYDARETMAKKYLKFFTEHFSNKVITYSIRTNMDIRRMTDEKKSIFDKKTATSAEDYLNIALELSGIDLFADSSKNTSEFKPIPTTTDLINNSLVASL
jgi:chromosome partitioning protein